MHNPIQTSDQYLAEKINEETYKRNLLNEKVNQITQFTHHLNNLRNQTEQHNHDQLRNSVVQLDSFYDKQLSNSGPSRQDLESRRKALESGIDITKRLFNLNIEQSREKKRQINELRSAIETIRNQQIDDADTQIQELEAEISRKNQEMSHRQSNRNALTEEITTLNNLLHDKRQEKERLRSMFTSEDEENEILSKRLSAIENRLSDAEEEMKRQAPLDVEIQSLTQSISHVSNELLHSKLVIKDMTDGNELALSQVEELENIIRQKETEIANIDENIRLEEERTHKYKQELSTQIASNDKVEHMNIIEEYIEHCNKLEVLRSIKMNDYEKALDDLMRRRELLAKEVDDALEKVNKNKDEYLRFSQDDISFNSFDAQTSDSNQVIHLRNVLKSKQDRLHHIDDQLDARMNIPVSPNMDIRELENMIEMYQMQLNTLENTLSKHQNTKTRHMEELKNKTVTNISSSDKGDFLDIIAQMESLYTNFQPETEIDDPEERLHRLKNHLDYLDSRCLTTSNFRFGSRVLCVPGSNYYYLYNTEDKQDYFLSQEIEGAFKDQIKKKEPIFAEILAIEKRTAERQNRYHIPVGQIYHEIFVSNID